MDSKKQEHIKGTSPRGFCPSGNVALPRQTGELGGGWTEGSKKSIGIEGAVALTSFVVAVAFAVAGFITPPQGELHESNLYLVAQFLLVTTSIFGVSAVITHGRWHIEASPRQ